MIEPMTCGLKSVALPRQFSDFLRSEKIRTSSKTTIGSTTAHRIVNQTG